MSRFKATVDSEGRLIPAIPERLARYRGREVWAEVHKYEAPQIRSSPSNRLLWGVIYRAISEETGNDPETIHQALKREGVRVGVLDPQYVLMGDRLFEDEPTTVQEQAVFSRYTNWLIEGCETGSLLGVQIHIPVPEPA